MSFVLVCDAQCRYSTGAAVASYGISVRASGTRGWFAWLLRVGQLRSLALGCQQL